jgi:AraC-like DNA-binding protein
VQHAADLAEFLAAPVGRCLAGPCWLYFYPRPTLAGFAIWGRPDADAIERLIRVLRVELDAPPHVSLVDARRLESVDPRAFDAIGAYVTSEAATLARVVRKLALVAPSGGMIRAVAAGFFDVAPQPYPVTIFDDAERAFAWLGEEDAASVLDAIARAEEEPADLARLRGFVEAHLADVDVDRAAKALGQSTRSLQRRLKEAGTSFQREVKRTQLAVAQRLLRDTDASVTRVALDVGLSPAHFSAIFRSETGLSPREWRDSSRRPRRT